MLKLVVDSYLEFYKRYAPLAQLDRVAGFEPVGCGFESLMVYHKQGEILVFFEIIY